MMMAEHPELSAAERAGKAFPVSWDQFHRDCRALTWRLNEGGPIHAVDAITRGGRVPAALQPHGVRGCLLHNVCGGRSDHGPPGDLKMLKGIYAGSAQLGRRHVQAPLI